jgi:type I restriction enzyme S subunit
MLDMHKNLQKGWLWTKLGEISELIRGVTYKKIESSRTPKYGYLPILRANNINKELEFSDLVYVPQRKIKKEQYVKANDILIAMSSGSKHLVGKAAQALNDFNGGFGTFCGLIRVSTDFDKRFLGLFFQCPYYRNEIAKLSLGVNINNLRREHIELMTFPLPPLPEQHRIVAKIEELFTKLDAGIEALKKIKIQLKRYRHAVLKHAFGGKLTAEWRKKNPFLISGESSVLKLYEKIKVEKNRSIEDKKFSNTIENEQLFDLPKEWIWCRLHEVTQATQGTQIPKKEQIRKEKNGFIRYLYISDFISDDNKIYVKNIYPHKIVSNKNLIMVNTGATAGTVFRGKYGVLSNNLFFISFPERYLERDYLYYFLSSNFFQGKAKLKGAANPHMGHEKFGRSIFPFAPLDEQRQIVSEIEQRFSVTDEVEKVVEQSFKQAERLRQSILKKAFEGKLVPQDPSDEPAEKLLELIKAEKAKYDKEKSSKKRWIRKTK